MSQQQDQTKQLCSEINLRVVDINQWRISDQWTDCEFLVEDKVIKAHRLILAMASPVFEAMLFGPLAAGDKPIPIPDVSLDAFKSLIQYIYTNNIKILSINNAYDLYYGAQKYMLPHLSAVCVTYLSCNLTAQNACRTFEFAELVGEKKLSNESLKLFRKRAKEVLIDNSSFEDLQPKTIVKLFSEENLNIDSELDLYQALERYAKRYMGNDREIDEATGIYSVQAGKEDTIVCNNNMDENEILTNIKSELKEANRPNNNIECIITKNKTSSTEDRIDPSLRKALEQIRFLSLTPKELAEYPTLDTLLTHTEILALFMNIASTETHMEMPNNFSTSREKRSLLKPREATPTPQMYKNWAFTVADRTSLSIEDQIERGKLSFSTFSFGES